MQRGSLRMAKECEGVAGRQGSLGVGESASEIECLACDTLHTHQQHHKYHHHHDHHSPLRVTLRHTHTQALSHSLLHTVAHMRTQK